jgi:hypothetical protein
LGHSRSDELRADIAFAEVFFIHYWLPDSDAWSCQNKCSIPEPQFSALGQENQNPDSRVENGVS